MTPAQHYARAEKLLLEGVQAARTIRELADARGGWAEGDEGWSSFTRQMDEYGKKAMGIWAQAQVHATLATVMHRTGGDPSRGL